MDRGREELEAIERGKGAEKAGVCDPKLGEAWCSVSVPPESHGPKALYIVSEVSGHVEPRLRLWVSSSISPPESGHSPKSVSASIVSNDRDGKRAYTGISDASQDAVATEIREPQDPVIVELGHAHIVEMECVGLLCPDISVHLPYFLAAGTM